MIKFLKHLFSCKPTTIVIHAPGYLGDRDDLVRALQDLKRKGQLP